MNKKRLIFACIAVFVFVFLYEWVFHGMILKGAYMQTANLWRPQEDFNSHFSWLVLGLFIQAVTFCFIYAVRPGHSDGVGAGIGFGFLIGLMRAGVDLITYAVQPIPGSIIGSWFAGGLIETMLAGAILGAIYRQPTQAAEPARAGATA